MFNFIAQNDINPEAAAGMAAMAGIVMLLIILVVAVVIVASTWKIFTKAGQPGWASIVPIYYNYVLVQVTGKPILWFILSLIPFINIIVWIMLMNELSKRFGGGIGTTLGLIFLPIIFFPVLGFGSAQYQSNPSDSGAI
jgi:hypothetical protein